MCLLRTKSCEACPKAKVHKHTNTPLDRLPAPTKRFSRIQVHLVGPLNPACEGKNTLLTLIDRWIGLSRSICDKHKSMCQGVGASVDCQMGCTILHTVSSPQIYGWKFTDVWELRVTQLPATIRNTTGRLNGCIDF